MPTRNNSTANICWGRVIRKNFFDTNFSTRQQEKGSFCRKIVFQSTNLPSNVYCCFKIFKKISYIFCPKRRNVTAFFLFVKHFSKRTCDCSAGGRFFKCANLCFGVFRRDTPFTQLVRQPQNMACNGKRFNWKLCFPSKLSRKHRKIFNFTHRHRNTQITTNFRFCYTKPFRHIFVVIFPEKS